MKSNGLRWFKLSVILGFPLLGLLYAYQFTGQERELVVPFHSFKAPSAQVSVGGEPSRTQGLSFQTPVTIVNFWATWCPPCVEEFPAMVELQRQLEGKGVQIVFVSVNEKWADVEQFLKVNSIKLTEGRLFWDPLKTTAAAWGSTKFPETYVVRRDGWVVEKVIGLQQWTRPVVIKYFLDLGEKFKSLPLKASLDNLNFLSLPQAWAADSKSSETIAPEPLLHEQDQKTLTTMRTNIETATQNLQKAEAALREEDRNLKEQKVVHDRKKKEQLDSESDLEKIETKSKEIKTALNKTEESLRTEEREKKKIEGLIKDIQARIADLQRRIEESKDQLNQGNKSLNTRVQTLETLEKAKESSEEEMKVLQSKVERAKVLVGEKRQATLEASKEIDSRERRIREIRNQVALAEETLKKQKLMLEEFEKLLKH